VTAPGLDPAAPAEVQVPACILPALTLRVGDAVRLAGSDYIWIVRAVFPGSMHPAMIETSGIRYRPHRQEIFSVTPATGGAGAR
jgi:hypothetical protein